MDLQVVMYDTPISLDNGFLLSNLQSKASGLKTFSMGPQLSAGFWSQTVTVGNWISSIGADIVSNVVITGFSDHCVKAWFIITPAIIKPQNVIAT